MFVGEIPSELARLAHLQFLDLAHNNLTGSIHALLVMDLSGNNLSSQIPEEIVALGLLQSLNLSGNHLTGIIPEKLGDIRSLESLDLLLNELQGAIPQSLSALTFLNYLNLSYNNLSGRIPTGSQLGTLDNSSIYIGNTYLCGSPTGKNCSENETMPNIVRDNYNGSESTWPYLGMGLGFAVGFWSVCGILIFKES
uniref:Uncharacterized protein n=1 Tax=Ananas comosus var. bracteatus TaxID=296719 RepID=A0A6V7NSR2_ANACO|nr:unnamed protein product [Ananas comosus var. bracteatus]